MSRQAHSIPAPLLAASLLNHLPHRLDHLHLCVRPIVPSGWARPAEHQLSQACGDFPPVLRWWPSWHLAPPPKKSATQRLICESPCVAELGETLHMVIHC